MKTRWFGVLGALLVIALVTLGCRKSESEYTTATTDTTTPTATSTTGTGTTGGTASPLREKDKEFVVTAAEGGMTEVDLGKMAVAKANSDDVRSFANRMVNDHGKANDELKSLATTRGLAFPNVLGAENQKTVDELSKKSGKEFDNAYMTDMVKDHENDVKEFEKASRETQDPDLKAWVMKTLPTLQEHLTMARATVAKLK